MRVGGGVEGGGGGDGGAGVGGGLRLKVHWNHAFLARSRYIYKKESNTESDTKLSFHETPKQ